jgi:hypothetical protein
MSLFFSWRMFAAAVVLGGAAASAACSTMATTAAAGEDNGPVPEDRGEAGTTASLADDAGASPGASYRGNPLCYVTPISCMPDDDAYSHAAGTAQCVAPAVDGGGGDDGGAQATACRLTNGADGLPTPDCVTATSAGGDGTSCTSGSDCAPGFDCVEGDKGSVCRRYCCLDSCAAQTSQNGGATFCDVQKLVDTNQKAPVCMPLKRCKLLTAGECSATETCAVVDETGDTGCVGVGPAQVGQGCDDAHCAAGLTCLGQSGNRKCYQLCRVSGTACGPSQVCKTSTVFKDMTIGVCQSL